MKRKPALLVVLVITTIAVVGGGLWWKSHKSTATYEEVHPKRGEIIEAVYALGKVKSDRRFEVKLGVISTVREVYVREGQHVKTGQPLMRFDFSLFKAPFDGVVTLVAAYAGETAVPQVAVLRMEDPNKRYIELSLEQQSALRVKVGQTAKASFESLRGAVLTGKISALFSRDDEFLAHVEIDDLEQSILPGMTADVAVEVGKIGDALMIPLRAISSGMVIIKRPGGKREKVKVEVGNINESWAEIKGSTLSIDDVVIVPNARK